MLHLLRYYPAWFETEVKKCATTSQKLKSILSGCLTWWSTINSEQTFLMSQPPPIKNEIRFPTILKNGEARVPWGPSPWTAPAVAASDGLFSYPPIHQSPCCLAGCWPFPRAVGLSPKVGWLLNTVPVLFQPCEPASKSNLHASEDGKKIWGDIYNMLQPYNISPTDWGYILLSSTKKKPFKVWTILSTVIQDILRQN